MILNKKDISLTYIKKDFMSYEVNFNVQFYMVMELKCMNDLY